MRTFLYGLTASLIFLSFSSAPKASAQISVGINIGEEPTCAYGYYDYAPYPCAPYGYYGPQWFSGGRFIGTGQWFHGPANFNGQVNNRMDPRHGYKGALPDRGPAQVHPDNFKSFKGNEQRDSAGHATPSHGRK